jgi:pimeloyl-ACP methyl ester carboxylesterase
MKNKTHYHFAKINGVDIFYREAGPADAPALLLLNGYPNIIAYVPQPDK